MSNLVKANEAFEKGQSYFKSENYGQSIKYFMQATLLDTGKAEYQAWLARAFNCQENYASALETANQALELDSNCSLAYRQRAFAYERHERNYPNAIRDYSHAIRLNPEDVVAYYGRACVYYQIDEYAKAIRDCSRVIQIDSMYASAYYKRGESYKMLGNLAEAIDDYSHVIRLDPTHEWAYLDRGNCYSALSKFSMAIQDCSRAIELDPKDKDNNFFCAHAYNSRARAYHSQNDFTSAIRDYSHVIDADDKCTTGAYRGRGIVYFEQEEYTSAIQDFSKAIQLDPKNPDVYIYRGNAYHDQKDYSIAIQDFSTAIELDPNNWMALFNRGLAYTGRGEYKKAIADLSRAVELNPRNATVHKIRGDFYMEQNDPSNAIRDYFHALRIAPDDIEIQQALHVAQKTLSGEIKPVERLSDEAADFFNQAVELIQNAEQHSYDRACRDAISLLSLAISKAGIPFPPGHALKAILYLDIEEYEAAWNEANQALKLDPNQFRAQYVKTRIAGGSVQVADTNLIGRLVKVFGKYGSVRESYETGYQLSVEHTSQRRFKREVIKLLEIFQRLCAEPLKASEYLCYTEMMIELADVIIQNRIPLNRRANIYSCVASTPVNNLVYKTDDEKQAVNSNSRFRIVYFLSTPDISQGMITQ